MEAAAAGEDEEDFSGEELQEADIADPDEPSSPDLPKKTRPSRACDWCRKKKIKCDGNPCANCRRFNVNCTFMLQNRKRPPRKDQKYVAKLEDRVEKLQARFAKEAPEAWRTYEFEQEGTTRGGRRSSRSRRSDGLVDPATRTVNAGGLLLIDGTGFGTYLGPTSPWAFLHDTRIYASQMLHTDIATASPLHNYLAINAHQVGLSSSLQAAHFTPTVSAEQARPYIEAWFTNAKAVHGYLHRPTFDRQTSNIHTMHAQISFDTTVLYYSVIGLGAWLRGETRRSTQFLQIAFGALSTRLFMSQTVEAVQGVFLLAYLLALLGRYGMANGMLGHAIRLAHANGMHRDATIQRQDALVLNPIQIEERRRTFWGIYHLDSLLSIILGRPPSIPEWDVDTEQPQTIDDSRITADGILPEEIEEEVEDYVHSSQRSLSQQIRKIYENLYSVTATTDRLQADLAITIYNMDLDLSGWRAILPTAYRPFLSAENPETFDGASALQVYFSVAYYFCQCLIHRPALIEATRAVNDTWHGEVEQSQSPEEGYADPKSPFHGPGADTLKNSADRCVVAARDLLNLILSAPSANTQFLLLPAVIVTASTILVDNIIRTPFAETAGTDLELLQNVISLEQRYDDIIWQPLVPSLKELEGIANTALGGISSISVPPSALSRTSAPQLAPVYQPQPSTTQQWNTEHLSYDNPEDQFLAGPISYDSSYPVSAALQTSHSQFHSSGGIPVYGGPTSPPFQVPYQLGETDPSVMANLRQQVISAPPDVQHQFRIQSPLQQGFPPQTMSGHWRRNSSAEVMQATLHQEQRHGSQWTVGSGGYDPPSRPPPSQPAPTPTRPARGGHKKQSSRSSRGSHR